MATRAALLIASAGIANGVQVSQDPADLLLLVALGTGALAALCGLVALLPRRGNDVRIAEAEITLWNASTSTAIRSLTYWKLDTLREQERALVKRSRLLFAGFGLLAVSIVVAALAPIVDI